MKDRVFVVAGGATGIGAVTARQLVDAGAKLVVGDVNEEAGRATVEALGGDAVFQTFDIAEEESQIGPP